MDSKYLKYKLKYLALKKEFKIKGGQTYFDFEGDADKFSTDDYQYFDINEAINPTNGNTPSRMVRKMKGGGAWGYFSADNDYTQDLIMDNFQNRQNSVTEIKTRLKNIFDSFERDIKSKKDSNQNDTSQYNLNYAQLGVVTDLLLHLNKVPDEYLKRALIHAYREYVRIYYLQEASGWESYQERSDSLKYEIMLINYALNTGTPLNFPTKFLNYDDDVQYISNESLIKYMNQLVRQKSNAYLDNVYIKYNYRKDPQTKKVVYYPLLDPNILNQGIVMQGYHTTSSPITYYIVENQNDRHQWKKYDPYEDPPTIYISPKLLESIYGSQINRTPSKKKK